MSGTTDCVIAAGVESMTRVPMGLASQLPAKNGFGHYKSPGIEKKYPNIVFSQFTGAEMMAEKYGLSKDELDEYSYNSHQRAIAATQGGKFRDEIVPLQITRADGSTEIHTVDEGIRFDASLDGIRNVKLIAENGKLTAASASQICDGASGVMVVNEKGLKALGIKPMARIHHMTMMGGDPVIMLDAPLHATERALKKAGMSIDDIDLFEVNEAFASVPTAWLKTTGADPARAQRQWRRHRARPSARRLRHQADDHAGQCAEAAQQALRVADHVRRRRHGECDDRGKAVSANGVVPALSRDPYVDGPRTTRSF
jgi:acetyl-CoA C-acetyltransferase